MSVAMKLSEEVMSRHPALNPLNFAEPARECLRRYHSPPTTTFVVDVDGKDDEMIVEWHLPDPRQETSLQRPKNVELGAIAIACLLLLGYTKYVISDITMRGDGPDYWIGTRLRDRTHLIEISGTDEDSLAGRRKERTADLLANPYNMGGYVAVCRFRDPSASLRFVERGDSR